MTTKQWNILMTIIPVRHKHGIVASTSSYNVSDSPVICPSR